MRYSLMPRLMWGVFAPGFRRQLPMLDPAADGRSVLARAHGRYRAILADIPDFDPKDRFLVNILSAAMLAAVYLELGLKTVPETDLLANYYAKAMDNVVMRAFLKSSRPYTKAYQGKLQAGAAYSRRQSNPYSWVYDFQPGPDLDSYTTVFHSCGICYLLRSLGLEAVIPAMCRYDFTMASQSGTHFTRQYTLAGGGPYCDCHYRKAL